MVYVDYYKVLGIDPQANQKEISDKYKDLAKKWHPDKNAGKDTTKEMQLISEAYLILKDEISRKDFDAMFHKQNTSNAESKYSENNKNDVCFYCLKNIADLNCAYIENLYKETHRVSFPQRKVYYKTLEIKIPRCEKCYEIHNSRSRLLVILPVISFSLLGLILGLTIWSLWLLCLLAGFGVGVFLGIILNSIDETIIAHEAGIKKDSNTNAFESIVFYNNNGWSKSKPEA